MAQDHFCRPGALGAPCRRRRTDRIFEEPLLNGNTRPDHADPAGCSHDRWRRREAIEELVDSVIYIRECHQCGRLEIRARSGAAEEWHHIGYAHA